MKRKSLLLLLAGLFVLTQALVLAVKAEAKVKKANTVVDEDDSQAVIAAQDATVIDEDASDSSDEVVPSKVKRGKKAKKAKEPKAMGFGFGVDFGYTYLKMQKVNDAFNAAYGKEPVHDGFYVGLDLGLTLFHGILELGPRFEYIYTGAQVDTTYHSGYYSWTSSVNYSYSLVPVTFGVRFRTPGAVSLTGRLDVGEGFANAEYSGDYVSTVDSTGTCPVVDARLGLRFGRRFHGQVEGGYRSALVTNMTKNWSELDFSGYTIGGKVGFDF